MVLPLMPEFITPQDGAEKQDCERNAAKRWLNAHGTRVADLRPVYLGDVLFSCQPLAEVVLAAGADFLFVCKKDGHKTLYEFIEGAPLEELTVIERRPGKRSLTYRYRWIEAVPLNAILSAAAMNFQKLVGAFWRIFLRRLLRGWSWIPSLQWQPRLRTQFAMC
jgi:hypothetical protein